MENILKKNPRLMKEFISDEGSFDGDICFYACLFSNDKLCSCVSMSLFDLLFTTSQTPENTNTAAMACAPLNTARPASTLTVTDTNG